MIDQCWKTNEYLKVLLYIILNGEMKYKLKIRKIIFSRKISQM